MASERIEFEQAVDGLFRGALDAYSDPALVELLRQHGLDLTQKLKPAYPAPDFYRWVRLAARHRFPDVSEAEAVRQVGKLAVRRGLQSTVIGRAVLVSLKLLGIRRSLLKIGRSFRNGNNYIEATVEELAPTSLAIRLGPLVGPKEYVEGVLEEGPLVLGAKTSRVTELRTEGEHHVFQVDWTE